MVSHQLVFSIGKRVRKRTCLPSAENIGLWSSRVLVVSTRAPPPASGVTAISSPEVKATRLPSGEAIGSMMLLSSPARRVKVQPVVSMLATSGSMPSRTACGSACLSAAARVSVNSAA